MSEPKQLDASYFAGLVREYQDSEEVFVNGKVYAPPPPSDADLQRYAQSKRESMLARDWPARALDAAVSADKTKSAITKLGAWDQSERSACVLSGKPGTGKTVAAALWCLGRRERVQFVRASTFAASSRYNAEQRAKWFDADGLCLDDLGAEYLDAKGSFLVDLDELVDTFYADRRPLIITTNLSAAEFKKRYDRRIEDRIRECAAWLVVDGESMRRQP
jgi:DNA replication protein DnaC